MRDTNYPLCEVCKLQGYKRMSQLVSGKSLYVADPEVKKYTGQYSTYSEFEDTTYTGYYNFANLVAGMGGFAIFWFAVKKKTFVDLSASIKAIFTKKK